jgi:hypothetical protein
LYINYLPLNIQNAKLVLFADNINIIITDKSIDAVQVWLNRVINSLELGSQITAFIINADNKGNAISLEQNL